MTATVIPFTRFLEEREKRTDPKGYGARKMMAAIDRQVKASQASKPLLIGKAEPIDPDFDVEDIPVFDRKLLWGFGEDPREWTEFQGDPGDEI